jgi:hypothetical protein
MNYRKRTASKREPKKSYLVWIEGETEKNYVESVRDELKKRNINIAIIPKLSKKESEKPSADNLKSSFVEGEYTKLFCVMDIDTVIAEKKLNSDAQSYRNLKSIVQLCNKNSKYVFIPNTPCFEIWFYLHFNKSSKYFPTYGELIKELKKVPEFKNNDKNQKFTANLYESLKDKLTVAYNNSKALGEIDIDEIEKSKCAMYKMIDEFNLLSAG